MMKRALLVLLSGLLLCAAGVAIVAATGSDATLADGLRSTIAVVDQTAAELVDDERIAPRTDNARLGQADELRNNHSFNDHSASHLRPGLNDCDSWRNIFHDGWSATYALEIPLRDDQEAERMLEQVRDLWERRGFEVNTIVYPDRSGEPRQTRLFASATHANYQFNVQWFRQQANVKGTTHCLPPGPLGILWW